MLFRTIIQKVIIQTQLFKILTLFKKQLFKTIIRIDVVWTELLKKIMKQQNGQISKQFQFYRLLSRSLHMHKTLKQEKNAP